MTDCVTQNIGQGFLAMLVGPKACRFWPILLETEPKIGFLFDPDADGNRKDWASPTKKGLT